MQIETGYIRTSWIYDNIQRGIYIVPNYQREFCWSDDKINTLIDSIVNDIPIGVFQFRKVNKDGRLLNEVIDGLHRIRVMMNVLTGNGIYFDEQRNTFTTDSKCYDYSKLLTKNKLTTMFGSFQEYDKILDLHNAYSKFYFAELLHFTYSGTDEEIKRAFDRINDAGVSFTTIFNAVKKESILNL